MQLMLSIPKYFFLYIYVFLKILFFLATPCACGVLDLQPGIESLPPCGVSAVLTTALPRKSPQIFLEWNEKAHLFRYHVKVL